MKNRIKHILQKILGYHNYLFIFSFYIIYTLRYQRNEKDFLFFLKLIPSNKSVIDIGANIGAMTYHLSQKVKLFQVFAIEPQPDNLKVLHRIIRFLKLRNVTVLEIALGDKSSNIEMVLPIDKKTKLHGLSHVCHESIPDFNEGERFSVSMKRLDEIDEITNIEHIGGIKIDVENFEYFVLKGAQSTLIKHKPIIYTELWENQNRNLCIEFMTNLDYSCKVLINNVLENFDSSVHQTQNFFFLPKS